jgi:predicted glycogen debranching enzyme
VEQFVELTSAAHAKGARILLDMVINHTGWGSTLFENHPEWFLREESGAFKSPGAWGTVWEDLVELNPSFTELWELLAEAFLTWLRRGVDGFRCDAGYMIPQPVWTYIIARARQEFPDAIFLLEGLGGPWTATETLLTEGGMQWAYSELFQNETPERVSWYLDYSLRQSARLGIYANYSETHDNDRLAKKGRVWSLMRNRLCGLASVSGAYGYTCGVEWLADEKIEVHQSRGLAWNNPDNLVPELSRLASLLSSHPCFFDRAQIYRVSPPDSPVLALHRQSSDAANNVLALVNMDIAASRSIDVDRGLYDELGRPDNDLLGQAPPRAEFPSAEVCRFTLGPGAAYCLSPKGGPRGPAGDEYRRRRDQAAWAVEALGSVLMPEEMLFPSWQDLARRVDRDPYVFLASAAALDRAAARKDLFGALDAAAATFPKVVTWTVADARKTTLVPPGHWVLLRDPAPFVAGVRFNGSTRNARSIATAGGWVASVPPQAASAHCDAELTLERFTPTGHIVQGLIRFLTTEPENWLERVGRLDFPEPAMTLLTNGRGGMARLAVRLGRIFSKYDCALGANLNAEVPVDRHVFAKRVRAWANANGFITELGEENLVSFEPGPPARWRHRIEAGDGRLMDLYLTADMLAERNTTVFRFERGRSYLVAGQPRLETRLASEPGAMSLAIVVRVDIEDRNFHSETYRNVDAERFFRDACRPLGNMPGFLFAAAPGRRLRVYATAGAYNPEEEWSHTAHPNEQSRGQAPGGDAFSPGWFELPLAGEGGVTLALCAEADDPSPDVLESFAPARVRDNERILALAGLPDEDRFGRQLVLAARACVARRGAGKTVIAGYPWFLDWGRDTFIAARGLLAAGWVEDVTGLLRVFGRFVEKGTMPNTIHGDNASNRETSDAPLWFGVVCEEAARVGSPDVYALKLDDRGRTLAEALREIAIGYSTGAPNGIRMDKASGLVWSPAHYTWMDTNHPAGTPREGYPVEIQVLWIQLLRQMARLGAAPGEEPWADLLDRATTSFFARYWLEEEGYFADSLAARSGLPAASAPPDNALRGNYLHAINFGLVTGLKARRAVDAALRHLVVPGALRSLAPLPAKPPLPICGNDGRLLNDPENPYWGRYLGDEDTRRKPAYHNGTAWTWTFPGFCEALARAWDFDPAAVAAAKSYLGSVARLLTTGCLGHVPEILDGDSPHHPRGCDAQAWGATEALRVWKLLSRPG